jgi:hypothetical protein
MWSGSEFFTNVEVPFTYIAKIQELQRRQCDFYYPGKLFKIRTHSQNQPHFTHHVTEQVTTFHISLHRAGTGGVEVKFEHAPRNGQFRNFRQTPDIYKTDKEN